MAISAVEKKKREYVFKALFMQNRKGSENYIVNGIWHSMDNLNIKPVTQQLIKGESGKIAVLDLYFPQLNYGIKCMDNLKKDIYDIDSNIGFSKEKVLYHIEHTPDFRLRKISTNESIEKINKRISELVEEVHSLISERNPVPWDITKDSCEIALKKQFLSVEDNLEFYYITDICSIFGKLVKRMQLAFLDIGKGYELWCPKLAITTENGLKAVANGWINEMSLDGEVLSETRDTKEEITVKKPSRPRLTFAMSKNEYGDNIYKFIGIFLYDKTKSTKEKNLYVRIGTEIDLKPWNVVQLELELEFED